MDWVRLDISRIRELSATPADVFGDYVRLIGYAAHLECGGIIPGSAAWSRRDWLVRAGVSLRNVQRMVSQRLVIREDDVSFRIKDYDVQHEIALHKRREYGKLGGRPANHMVNQVVTPSDNQSRVEERREEKRSDPPSPPLGGGVVPAGSAPKPRKPALAPEYSAEFTAIWEKTGKSGNKFPAWVAWKAVGSPSPALVLEGWQHHERNDHRWRMSNGARHIPHLSTWLNARGWEDRPTSGNGAVQQSWEDRERIRLQVARTLKERDAELRAEQAEERARRAPVIEFIADIVEGKL